MSQRCDSDSNGINFDGKSVEESGPSTSTSASTSLYRPPSKRQKVSRRLPVDFDSTTEEEQGDEVDFQVNLTLTYLIFTRTHSLQNVATLYNIFVLEMWCFPAPRRDSVCSRNLGLIRCFCWKFIFELYLCIATNTTISFLVRTNF